MTRQPLVSVVLCTYNGSFYLNEQLNSILAQTYTNIEIIAVDDCSADNTVILLREHCKKDARIKLFINEVNLGYNKNFEKGCTLSNGQFIAIADQDDIWDINKLQIIMNEFLKEPAAVMVHCNSAIFETGQRAHKGSVRAKRQFEGNDARKFFLYNQISGHNMIFKKELLASAIPFPEKFYYDWWLAVTACCNGIIKAADKILVYQRKHENNSTYNETKPLYFYQAVLLRLPVLLTAKGLTPQSKKFGVDLLKKFSVLKHQAFSIDLFWFIIKNAKVIFFFKRKIFPYFSYLKHAVKISGSSAKAS